MKKYVKKIVRFTEYLFDKKCQSIYVGFLEKHYLLIIILAFLLSGVSFYYGKNIKLRANFADLLPDNTKSVTMLHKVEKEVGGVAILTLVVESPDLNQSKAFAEKVAPQIQALDTVDFVYYKIDKSFFKKNKILYADLEDLKDVKNRLEEKIKTEKLKQSGLYLNLFEDEDEKSDKMFNFEDLEAKYKNKYNQDYLVDEKNNVLAIIIKPKGDTSNINFSRKLINTIMEIGKANHPESFHPAMKLSIAGSFKKQIKQHDTILKDLKQSGGIALIVVAILLSLFLKGIVPVIIAILPLVMGIVWTMLFTALSIGYVNMLTGFLFAILLGLGIESGIHIVSRYQEERSRNASPHTALTITLSKTGKAALTSLLSTAVSFYSLMFTDFKGFSQLGFITGTGLMMYLPAMYIVLPSLLIFAEKMKLLKMKPFKINPMLFEKPLPLPRIFLSMSIFLTIAALILLIFHKVDFEYNFKNLTNKDEVEEKISTKVNKIYKKSISPAVIMTDSLEDIKAVDDYFKNYIKHDTTRTIDTVWTIFSFLPSEQDQKLAVISNIRTLLGDKTLKLVEDKKNKMKIDEFRKMLAVEKLTIDNLPDYIKKIFTTRNGKLGTFGYIFSNVQLWDVLEAKAFADDVREVKANGKTFYTSGNPIILVDTVESMIRDGKIAIILALSVIFLLILLDFQSFRLAFLILVPLIGGILWMLLIMYLFDIKLGFFNMIILPILLGIAVDNGIHFVHRYLENPTRRNLLSVVKYTGGAIIMCTATNIAGFVGLLFCEHQGLRSIGVLAVIGLLTCLLASFIFLPSILQLLENRKNGI